MHDQFPRLFKTLQPQQLVNGGPAEFLSHLECTVSQKHGQAFSTKPTWESGGSVPSGKDFAVKPDTRWCTRVDIIVSRTFMKALHARNFRIFISVKNILAALITKDMDIDCDELLWKYIPWEKVSTVISDVAAMSLTVYRSTWATSRCKIRPSTSTANIDR